jgi:VWFA-related protein
MRFGAVVEPIQAEWSLLCRPEQETRAEPFLQARRDLAHISHELIRERRRIEVTTVLAMRQVKAPPSADTGDGGGNRSRRMIRTTSILATLGAVCLGVAVAAQKAQEPSFTAATRTVAVYATVTNAQGRLVPDLSREDFTVDDDGRRQTLTVFSNDVQPITVVMLLDRSGSMKPNFDLEERAAEAFVHAMGPDDKARIGSFAAHIQIDPPEFSSDRDALVKVLHTELQTDGPTPLWNAVDTAIDKLILEPGRRVVLVFTDGVDMPLNFSGRNKSLKDVMKRAEERDVMVYAIGLAGDTGMPDLRGRTPDRGARGGPIPIGGIGGRGSGDRLQLEKPDEGLPKIAAATGGGYFELMSARDLPSTFARVADELHHQYSLGFTPEKLDGKLHDLTVRVSQPNLTVRARKRYVASKPL